MSVIRRLATCVVGLILISTIGGLCGANETDLLRSHTGDGVGLGGGCSTEVLRDAP